MASFTGTETLCSNVTKNPRRRRRREEVWASKAFSETTSFFFSKWFFYIIFQQVCLNRRLKTSCGNYFSIWIFLCFRKIDPLSIFIWNELINIRLNDPISIQKDCSVLYFCLSIVWSKYLCHEFQRFVFFLECF